MIDKKNLSSEDKEAWERFTKDPPDIYDKDLNNKKKGSRKHRFKFDLHGFTLEDANKKIQEIILSGVGKKYEEILLVTGKGLHSKSDQDAFASQKLSKLKYSVPEFINNNPELAKHVISISEASSKDGGAGAILIKLKNL